MLEELKNKMELLYHDHENKQLQKEILELALTDLSHICVSGLQVYDENKDYLNNLIGQDLVNADTCKKIKELLIEDNNIEGFEDYIWKKRAAIERVYSSYFHSYTSRQDDGRVYNSILNMYWSEEAQLWQSDGSDGWVRFTMMMPYKNTTAEAETPVQLISKKSKYFIEGGTYYEKSYA